MLEQARCYVDEADMGFHNVVWTNEWTQQYWKCMGDLDYCVQMYCFELCAMYTTMSFKCEKAVHCMHV